LGDFARFKPNLDVGALGERLGCLGHNDTVSYDSRYAYVLIHSFLSELKSLDNYRNDSTPKQPSPSLLFHRNDERLSVTFLRQPKER